MLAKRLLIAATLLLLLYASLTHLTQNTTRSSKTYPKNPSQVTKNIKGMTLPDAQKYITTHTDYTYRTAPASPPQDYSPTRINLIVANNEVLGAYFG